MQIVIYDTEHFETTYALIRIFDTPQNNITIFTTVEMSILLKQMLSEKAGCYSWMIKDKRSYTFDLYKYCRRKKASHLFLNTVSYHHIFFAILCFFLRQTKSILTIHAANS